MDQPKKTETDILNEVKRESQSSQLISEDVEELSSSPRSSPPIVESERFETETLSPSRKRSHEEMNANSEDKSKLENVHDSSSTAVDEGARPVSHGEPSSDFAKMSSTAAHTMPPPPLPASRKLPSSEEPPQSAQGFQKHQPPASMTGQRNPKVVEIGAEDSSSDDAMNDDAEPSQSPVAGIPDDKIEDFDWRDLEERYHAKIEELKANENGIIAEFDRLCNFFGVWAQCGSAQEVDRSYKRLKTQMTLVQHREDELEQKRLHYIKVVNAFKSALDLLKL